MNCSLSYWEEDIYGAWDLIVIGGGIVGVNAAITYKQQNPSKRVAVIERGVLPTGASTKNAGFACIGSMTELLADVAENGQEKMLSVLKKRWEGLQALRDRVLEQEMDYHNWGGIEIFLEGEEAIFSRCLAHLPEINQVLAPITNQAHTFRVYDHKITELGLAGISHLII
ncbi:MAG: FAD-dependent oxidoreductase, partial [Bacteroidota bacterium]